MISAATIAALEERGLEYILGARERTDSLVRRVVLADDRAFHALAGRARQRGGDPALGQGGAARGPALHRLPQRGRGREGPRRPQGRHRRPRAAAAARRQGADRQLRLPPLPAPRRAADAKGGKASPGRPSRSTPASWPRRPGTTASSCCAPTPASRRCRRCSDIASCSPSRTCSAKPKALLRTRPDLPLLRRRHPRPRLLLLPRPGAAEGAGRAAAGPQASRPNGLTCCATSTGCRRSRSPRTVSGSPPGPRLRARWGWCSRQPALPCRRTSVSGLSDLNSNATM